MDDGNLSGNVVQTKSVEYGTSLSNGDTAGDGNDGESKTLFGGKNIISFDAEAVATLIRANDPQQRAILHI